MLGHAHLRKLVCQRTNLRCLLLPSTSIRWLPVRGSATLCPILPRRDALIWGKVSWLTSDFRSEAWSEELAAPSMHRLIEIWCAPTNRLRFGSSIVSLGLTCSVLSSFGVRGASAGRRADGLRTRGWIQWRAVHRRFPLRMIIGGVCIFAPVSGLIFGRK